MTEQIAIKAKNIVKKFGDFKAIDDISLTVPKGCIYGFLGSNGCGKSTTIRTLTGLLTPSSGEIEVLGYQIPKDAEALRLKIGYMTQKFALYDDLSVEENLSFIGQIYGIEKKNLKLRIEEQLVTYGLEQLRKQRVKGMSGGQKQRLSLASATMNKPELLFLDEPTSAVDPENRREFWEKLFDLSDQGTTILITTHYMDEAEKCHRIAIMESGRMKADGEPEVLMKQMGVNVVEIKAEQLRQIKPKLLAKPQIRTAAQLGIRLRVLIYQDVDQPTEWLRESFPDLIDAEIELVRPSLEDVFVSMTGEGRQ